MPGVDTTGVGRLPELLTSASVSSDLSATGLGTVALSMLRLEVLGAELRKWDAWALAAAGTVPLTCVVC